MCGKGFAVNRIINIQIVAIGCVSSRRGAAVKNWRVDFTEEVCGTANRGCGADFVRIGDVQDGVIGQGVTPAVTGLMNADTQILIRQSARVAGTGVAIAVFPSITINIRAGHVAVQLNEIQKRLFAVEQVGC